MVNKICRRCGKDIPNASINQKYCYECEIEARREKEAEYQKKMQKEKQEKRLRTINDKCCICNKQASGYVGGKPFCYEHFLLEKKKIHDKVGGGGVRKWKSKATKLEKQKNL